ncbi:NADP-dependent oxidoreductase [Saccharibacillus endophyticus]|uniref:NADPH:quinone reductase n=1 Tax=Saccharibacillus endophyticus TaxID=2060666 RepID=A0ABQ1ZTM5_9BACL|nr:NADP-dependent oxidoreductase [Saccharibacillus endophyticus]GGH76693.1 NADPH:quinone reductase [Saccharibacillus endophyticus]
MNQTKMQAILVDQYGDADVLELRETNCPKPQEDEVLVRISFAAMIPLDWKIRNGWLEQVFPTTFPYTPGFYASGIVETVGSQVAELQPGDRVFGDLRGSYAQYAVAKEDALVKLPDSISLEDAAAIKAGADSAWKALFLEGNLQSGQTVLIHAAAGGVGQFAVQLAKWKGATVIGTASADNLEFVKSLGADMVIDYRSEDFSELVKDVDLVVDTVGGDTEQRSWGVLKRGGILVSLVGDPDAQQAAAHGVTAKFNTVFAAREHLLQIVDLLADGTLKMETGRAYPLSEAGEAQRFSEQRRGRGRILLNPEA